MATRLMARLLTVVVALNALMPVGFMPDLKALDQGRIEIVLCTAEGPALVTLDLEGRLVPPPPAGKAKVSDHSPCVWAPVLTKVFIAPVDLPQLAGLAVAKTPPVHRIDQVVPDQTGRIPLGSRAPPSHLV